ncbi:MAG TPA: hypothetical protein VHD81_08845 [Mycobacteriales bacterium]|nr:hypothetical protein [Mycobacteriales bacterium]
MADSIQLTDLDVIARYSIAVRSATADRDELLETLRADVAWLERGRSRTSTSAFRSADAEAEDGAEGEYGEPETLARPKRTTSAKRTTARRAPRA